jgi:hypothetical protein
MVVVAEEARRTCCTAIMRLAGEMAAALARMHDPRPVARRRDCRAITTISEYEYEHETGWR